MNTPCAVCHLQCGSSNNNGTLCFVERIDINGNGYMLDNTDARHTHFNRELITLPKSVKNKTNAFLYLIDNTKFLRMTDKNQYKAVSIIIINTNGQMVKMQNVSNFNKWIDADYWWLGATFCDENHEVSVLYMDEKILRFFTDVEMVMGVLVQVYVGTDDVDSSSEMPWEENKVYKKGVKR